MRSVDVEGLVFCSVLPVVTGVCMWRGKAPGCGSCVLQAGSGGDKLDHWSWSSLGTLRIEGIKQGWYRELLD